MKKILLILFLIGMIFVSMTNAQEKESATKINDKPAAEKLVGKHKLSLQWISWDYFGAATVANKKCGSGRCYSVTGEQKGRGNSDYLKIKGSILSIDAKQFTFKGTIETQISHINGGKLCVRSGEFTFKITGKRKYWRLSEMNNPCDEAADYVDIYFR